MCKKVKQHVNDGNALDNVALVDCDVVFTNIYIYIYIYIEM